MRNMCRLVIYGSLALRLISRGGFRLWRPLRTHRSKMKRPAGKGEPPHQTEEEASVEAQEPEAVPDFIPFLEDDLETEDRYPVGSYIDEAGNVWSQEGELLSSWYDSGHGAGRGPG